MIEFETKTQLQHFKLQYENYDLLYNVFFIAGKDEEHKKTKVTESKTQHDFEKSRTGQTGKVIHKTEHEEGGGKKHTHHDEGAHKSSEHHEGGSNDGLKYEDGAKHKKLNFKKVRTEIFF